MKKIPPIKGKVYIYALLDPFTMRVRYVGQSRDPVSRRRIHIAGVNHDSSLKDEWIRDIMLRGRDPILSILDFVDQSEADQKEMQWMFYCRDCGCQLLNTSFLIDNQGRRRREELDQSQIAQLLTIHNMQSHYRYRFNCVALTTFTFTRCIRLYRKKLKS